MYSFNVGHVSQDSNSRGLLTQPYLALWRSKSGGTRGRFTDVVLWSAIDNHDSVNCNVEFSLSQQLF